MKPITINLALVLFSSLAAALDSSPPPDLRTSLEKYCAECHAGPEPDGELRLDLLPAAVFADNLDDWNEVAERLREHDMPPKKARTPLPDTDREALLARLDTQIAEVETARQRENGRVVMRRLNRAEYQNTIRDLLSVDVDLADHLPADQSAHGFDNVGEALAISQVLMRRYLDTADRALDAAIVTGPKPETVEETHWLKEQRPVWKQDGKVFRTEGDWVVLFKDGKNGAPAIGSFSAPRTGEYRFRIGAKLFQTEEKFALGVMRGLFGTRGAQAEVIGFYDIVSDKPKTVEFTARLEKGETVRLSARGLPTNFRSRDLYSYEGPGVAVSSIKVEGPLIGEWPPASHRRLFGNVRVESADLDDASRLLHRFAQRAYRRKINESADIEPILALVKERLDAGKPFAEAMRTGFKAVLCSPEFLFLVEDGPDLNDYQLAARLSYFLWSSMPDDELFRLAAAGRLRDPAVISEQVERLLEDPRAAAFTGNFLGQWLDLRDIDFTTPDRSLYPEFDDVLRRAMLVEPRLFFEHILERDLGIAHFLDSDFTFLNERLAGHYGISGVTGQEFRKVELPAGSPRGGVLTQAAVMKVTANGTETSPVLRGVWVLENIFGTPPSPPPATVAAIEPDIRGATTIREQLAKHRNDASCARCHEKIDPPGFALENFDVIGGWRDHYRVLGTMRASTVVKFRRVSYGYGPEVDASGEAPPPAKTKFRDIDDYKEILLAHRDQFARCLTEKLVTYATGGKVSRIDEPSLEKILHQAREKNYGLRTLVHAVSRSDLFLRK